MNIVVKITRKDRSNPPGKLADAELHFAGGELDGTPHEVRHRVRRRSRLHTMSATCTSSSRLRMSPRC
jgi:hypothetical protein